MKIIFICLSFFIAGCNFQGPKSLSPSKAISTFDECVAEGNPVMESYPRQCRSKAGELFMEIIEDRPLPTTSLIPENSGGIEGEGVFCTMDAKMCPDGSSVGRIPPSCDFAPCP